MSAIAVVAGGCDAQFSEQVRAGLQAAGREAALHQQLPAGSSARVILIWSAGLESAHAIDAKTLIGLWSEDRLTVVRRDDTPLPLGLRDLPSLGPQASAEEVVRSALRSREAKPAEKSPRNRVALLAGWIFAIATVAGGGAWYYFNKANLEKQAALTAALESAARQSEALKAAQAQQQAALKKLEEARAAELAAIKAGDQAKIKEAQEAARRAEAEAATQAEAVKQREAAAAEARKKAQEGAKLAKAEAKSEPQPQVAAVATKAAEVPKAEAPATKAATSAPKGEPAAPKSVAQKKSGPLSRSERERLADEEAARKALANAGRPNAEQETVVASRAPSSAPGDRAAATATTSVDQEALYQQALSMENGGDAKGAIRIYRRAARAGSGKAAKRLGEIYDRGVPGVSRDYAESLQWYETARQLGESVESAGERGVRSAPDSAMPREPQAVAKSEPAAAPTMPEAAKAEASPVTREQTRHPSKESTVVSRAPASASAPKATPTPAPKAAPEKSAPAPAPVQEESKAAAPAAVPPPASIPESGTAETSSDRHRTGWRFAWIPILVLAIIFWRRARKRRARAGGSTVPRAAESVAAPVAQAQAPADGATLFVSYSHKDRSRVEPIVSVIEEMGRRVWMDRTDITGQAGWAGQIVRAIRECRAVVLMASPNSYGSDQVVRELYLAMNHKKAIVPIEIEPAEMPDELQYILAPYQHHRLSGGEARAVLGRALAAI